MNLGARGMWLTALPGKEASHSFRVCGGGEGTETCMRGY